jgi:cytochrome c peroxidase
LFPLPEGTTRFPGEDPRFYHLLVAQAHLPPTELPEMAGFTGIRDTSFATSRFQTSRPMGGAFVALAIVENLVLTELAPFAGSGPRVFSLRRGPNQEPDFNQFDDGHGLRLPPADSTGTRNEPIRNVVLQRLNANEAYVERFGDLFAEVAQGGPVDFAMIAQAIAEFEISLTFANAPIDRFARGELSAMTSSQKRGALLFFGKAGCVQCHAVEGPSNEMFSDFENHVVGVPQLAPQFGIGTGNVAFRNRQGQFVAGGKEDFGLEDISEQPADRYKFRTSPLRNIGMSATFFHNGAYTRLEDAIRHHLDPARYARKYKPSTAGVDSDLRTDAASVESILERLDPLLVRPIRLTESEVNDLVEFVRNGLLDPRATPERLRPIIPEDLPSGETVHFFE